MEQIKTQKSQFWIWTTLWLTTIIDSVLIFFLFFIVLALIAQVIKISAVILVLTFAARILSLWLGAYVAVKYVVKKTIVFKRDAHKFAFLAIVIPLIGNIVFIVYAASDIKNFLGSLLSAIIVLGITYYSVRRLIMRYGSE